MPLLNQLLRLSLESMDTAATPEVGDSSNSQDQLALNSPESEESIDSSDESVSPCCRRKMNRQE